MEKALLELPYIREAAVVGVDDEEFGQRVGAIVTLAQPQILVRPEDVQGRDESLNIDAVRGDLWKALPAYKLPTLLRIVNGELQKGQTGKVQKKVLSPRYFPVSGWPNDPTVQVWSRRTLTTRSKI